MLVLDGSRQTAEGLASCNPEALAEPVSGERLLGVAQGACTIHGRLDEAMESLIPGKSEGNTAMTVEEHGGRAGTY